MKAYPACSTEKFISCTARLPSVINTAVAFVWNLGELVCRQDAGEISGHVTAKDSVERDWLLVGTSVPLDRNGGLVLIIVGRFVKSSAFLELRDARFESLFLEEFGKLFLLHVAILRSFDQFERICTPTCTNTCALLAERLRAISLADEQLVLIFSHLELAFLASNHGCHFSEV